MAVRASEKYHVVRSDRFVEATRDSGYKGTVSALSEVIDNSIQAGATVVNVHLLAVEVDDKRRQPRVQEVIIADNVLHAHGRGWRTHGRGDGEDAP